MLLIFSEKKNFKNLFIVLFRVLLLQCLSSLVH